MPVSVTTGVAPATAAAEEEGAGDIVLAGTTAPAPQLPVLAVLVVAVVVLAGKLARSISVVTAIVSFERFASTKAPGGSKLIISPPTGARSSLTSSTATGPFVVLHKPKMS